MHELIPNQVVDVDGTIGVVSGKDIYCVGIFNIYCGSFTLQATRRECVVINNEHVDKPLFAHQVYNLIKS